MRINMQCKEVFGMFLEKSRTGFTQTKPTFLHQFTMVPCINDRNNAFNIRSFKMTVLFVFDVVLNYCEMLCLFIDFKCNHVRIFLLI